MTIAIARRLAALALLTLPIAVAAQGAPRSYAVVSEFARDIRVTIFAPTIGTRFDTNREERMAVQGGALDKLALARANQEIAAADPGAKVWLLSPLDTDLLDARADFSEGALVKLPSDLADAMKQRGSTHLLVFTRHRGEAALKTRNSTVGSGQLEGAGFYVDRATPMENLETLTTTVGFIAPYLYFRASLIDAGTGKVLRSRRIVASSTVAARQAERGSDPWNLMTMDEKVRVLSQMIIDEVGKAVPALLAAQ
jgi:hypothetical protein